MADTTPLRHFLPPAALALALLLALFVAWRDMERATQPVVQPVAPGLTTATDPVAAPPAAPGNATALPDWALFGVAETPATPVADPPAAPPPDEANLPESTASFQLFGLIQADGDQEARAILGATDADQRELQIGDQTPDGARIHAIRARALILERDGKLEQMPFPTAEGSSAGTPPPPRLRFLPKRIPGANGPLGGAPPAAALPQAPADGMIAAPPPEAFVTPDGAPMPPDDVPPALDAPVR